MRQDNILLKARSYLRVDANKPNNQKVYDKAIAYLRKDVLWDFNMANPQQEMVEHIKDGIQILVEDTKIGTPKEQIAKREALIKAFGQNFGFEVAVLRKFESAIFVKNPGNLQILGEDKIRANIRAVPIEFDATSYIDADDAITNSDTISTHSSFAHFFESFGMGAYKVVMGDPVQANRAKVVKCLSECVAQTLFELTLDAKYKDGGTIADQASNLRKVIASLKSNPDLQAALLAKINEELGTANIKLNTMHLLNNALKAKYPEQSGDVVKVLLKECCKQLINDSPLELYEAEKFSNITWGHNWFVRNAVCSVDGSSNWLALIQGLVLAPCGMLWGVARANSGDIFQETAWRCFTARELNNYIYEYGKNFMNCATDFCKAVVIVADEIIHGLPATRKTLEQAFDFMLLPFAERVKQAPAYVPVQPAF